MKTFSFIIACFGVLMMSSDAQFLRRGHQLVRQTEDETVPSQDQEFLETTLANEEPTGRQAPQRPRQRPVSVPRPQQQDFQFDQQQPQGPQQRPQRPQPQRPHQQPQGDTSSLTLPDGVDLIVGQVNPGFTCEGKIYGYYADTFNDCRVFHVCVPNTDELGVTKTIQWSFVCGNQTLFNQENLICDYQDRVDCTQAETFYNINEHFGRQEDRDSRQRFQ